MFILGEYLYDDEEILGYIEYESDEEYEEDICEIDTYTMLSFIVQDKYDSNVVCY